MSFIREENVTKETVKDFEIRFFVPDPLDEEGVQAGELSSQLGLSNGEIQVVKFDLLARLQDDAAGLVHLTNLISLRDYIRTRLNDEVLPV